ncbi:acylphosphatase [Amaricoccus solimangrovi]|uniref:acylphosphatase n=1 Tax=Amaricoccus solimangrovi TaxID=2589815 RepID=A0A501WTE0_9RHOB|nr:acylphosphatase [Amaricoccus solimangrovi]TPE52993.1 acylphosphatase [Amaricoccus solimangrovi]
METKPVSVTVHVIGKVQGVGFRAWTERVARGLGLTGWVGNDPDGSVRAVFTGTDEAVNAMLDRLREGPPAARVDRVTTEAADPADTEYDFRVIA